ncbi:MAG TPA: hypothetical protein VGR16_00770 [Thermomicrobiales bacterium]|nr:hypothetical protein [Thermomicrobiales bacterium]
MESTTRGAAPRASLYPSAAVAPGPAIERSPLDRALDLSAISWWTVGWLAVAITAVALRLTLLDVYALGPDEARRSFFAFALFQGDPLLPGESLPDTAPLFLLLQALGIFLFGVTDATARLVPALAGIAMIPLAAALRPFVGQHAAFAMALLIAISPTLTYASRIAKPDILISMLAMLLVVAVLRAGPPVISAPSVRRWAVTAGVAIAALIGSGPAAISVLLGLCAGAIAALAFTPKTEPSAVRLGLSAIARTPGALPGAAAAAIVTLMLLFTRLFTDLTAISGLVGTLADWLRLLATDATSTPIQIFVLIALLYEVLAVVFAVVATRGRPAGAAPLDWSFFGAWFITTLILFSFSEGRRPEHAAHVVLPLVLLAGIGLGNVFASLHWPSVLRGPGGLLFLTFLGAAIGLAAVGVLASRIGGGSPFAPSPEWAIGQTAVVALIVVGGFLLAAVSIIRAANGEGRSAQPGLILLLVALVFLGAYTFRTTTSLAFFRADEGHELVAQETATGAVEPLVERLQRLSRDVSIDRSSVRDPLGTYGLSVALDERVEWPYRWYFRRFTDVTVAAPGQAQTFNAEVVVAPDEAGLPEAGYTPHEYPYLNRVPAAFTTPDLSDVVLDILLPTRWMDGLDFLLYRDLDAPPPALTVEVGFNQEIANRLFPNSGPFGLLDRVGPGSGRGQFDSPRGIAVDPVNSHTYVVDSGNLEVDRFDADGTYIGSWGGTESAGGVQFGSLVLENGAILGPTGISTAPDGVVFVADTWEHRVVGLNADGTVVREIGSPGERTDLGDDPATVNQMPGLFFGPRDVTVFNDEIYVVDTGNERVQVFGLDGSFRRAFGGFGGEPGHLIEPVGIAVGPDGLIYVADSGNARISIFQPDGTPVAQWPVPSWEGQTYFEPYLAFGPDGLLYATSRATGSVEIFGPDGTIVESLTAINNVNLDGPVGITSAPDGSLLITDAGLSAVVRLVPPAALPVNGSIDNAAEGNGSGDADAEADGQDQEPDDDAAAETGGSPTSQAPPPPPAG